MMGLDPAQLLATLGLVLLLEGLLPFVAPSRWRRMMAEILKNQDGQIRFFGLICMVLGLILWLSFGA
jgi:uncharacterized protein YjeT (DUF2065 family)